MKFMTFTILSNTAIMALSAATPSLDIAYQLKVLSATPALKDAVLTVKDESSANVSPNALGVFSTGEPRSPYTFAFSTSAAGNGLYELKGTLRLTHLIITGDSRAMGFFDVPIGADPQPAVNETQFTNKWMVMDDVGQMKLAFAQGLNAEGSPNSGAGSWRACKGDSEVDYTLYWFDGLSQLDAIVKGCESVGLQIVEAKSSPTTLTGVTAPTATDGVFVTGVLAPSASVTGAFSGGNASSTGAGPTPSAFEGAASHLSMSGALMSFILGLATFIF